LLSIIKTLFYYGKEMNRRHTRFSGEGYNIQIKEINGEVLEQLSDMTIDIDDICKGGFRFTTSINLELEDRVLVLLHFPDGSLKEVLGRICYRHDADADDGSDKSCGYGFSVLGGFYNLAV